MILDYFEARAGAGKTYCLARVALRYAALGKKVIISQISCPLIENTFEEHFANSKIKITRIHSDQGHLENVTTRLNDHFKNAEPGGEILMCTHVGLMMLPYIAKQSRWTLIMDEVPSCSSTYQITDKATLANLKEVPSDIPGYVELIAASKSALKKTGEPKGFVLDVLGSRSRCYALEGALARVLGSDKQDKESILNIFSELRPELFDGYSEVVFVSALFRDTMLYKSFARQGVDWRVADLKRWKVTYPEHTNGHLLTIYYASERDFAKCQRTTMVRDDQGSEITYIAAVIKRVKRLFLEQKFLYAVNNDMLIDDLWEEPLLDDEFTRHGTRLSGSPHGINSYRSWHNVAILMACNPTSHYLSFCEARDIPAQQVKDAFSRQVCYQIVMRCSLRDAENSDPKTCVVMDKRTADYLAALFSGCKVLALPCLGSGDAIPAAKSGGRPQKHANDAEKMRAYRARKTYRKKRKVSLRAQIEALNSGADLDFAQHVGDLRTKRYVTPLNRKPLSKFRNACGEIGFPIWDNPATNTNHLCQNYGPAFLTDLQAMATRVCVTKADNHLISTTLFEDRPDCSTRIGRENVVATYGIWWDQDGDTDLTHEVFASWFPDLEIYIYATFSSTKAKPRWRAYMPTDLAMTGRDPEDVYWVIQKKLIEIVNSHNYYSIKEIKSGQAPARAKPHGFDPSVWRPEAKINLPCVPNDPEGAISRLLVGPDRGPIPVLDWIDNQIDDILDREAAGEALIEKAPHTSRTPTNASTGLPDASEQPYIDRAISDYDTRARGTGHDAFWVLACKLAATSLSSSEIETILVQAASRSGRSAKDRKTEIPGILKRVDRSFNIAARTPERLSGQINPT